MSISGDLQSRFSSDRVPFFDGGGAISWFRSTALFVVRRQWSHWRIADSDPPIRKTHCVDITPALRSRLTPIGLFKSDTGNFPPRWLEKAMISETRREATDDETLAEPVVDMDEGDRLVLMYAAPTDEATTACVTVRTNTRLTENWLLTPLTHNDPVDGTVPFWVRDFGRGGRDGPPSSVVRYRPVRYFSPAIRAYDQTPKPEATARIEPLGDVVRVIADHDMLYP